MLMRRLLDGERFSHEGPAYTFHDALVRATSRPARISRSSSAAPGRRKTLRTVAMRADAWNTSGTVDEVRDVLAIARGARRRTSAATSRTMEMTISFPIVIRPTAAAAEARYGELLQANGTPDMGNGPVLLGPPEFVADAIRPYRDLGFSTVIVRMPAPYDRETIDRMTEVQALLAT